MKTMERTFTLDRDLAQRADRKLHRYGMSLDDALAKTLVFVVSTRGNPWGNTTRTMPSVIEFDTQGEHFVADVTQEGDRYLAEVRGHPECFTEGGNEAELRRYLVEVTDGMLFGLGHYRKARCCQFSDWRDCRRQDNQKTLSPLLIAS